MTKITKEKFFGLLPPKQKIVYYLSFTNCTDSFLHDLLNQDEWKMDNICLTSYTKNESAFLKSILKEDLKKEPTDMGFSKDTIETIPDLFVTIVDGSGFRHYNSTIEKDAIILKVKELATKWGFNIIEEIIG